MSGISLDTGSNQCEMTQSVQYIISSDLGTSPMATQFFPKSPVIIPIA